MNQILANTSAFYGAQLVARVVNFGYVLVLARTLDPSGFGDLNLALAVLLIADTTADFGLSRLAMREMSRDLGETERYLGAFVALKLVTSTAAYLATLGFAFASGYPASVIGLIAVAGLGLVFTGAAMTLEMALHVRQRFGTVALAHLALSLMQAGTGLAALGLGGDALAIAATTVGTNAVYVAVVLAGLRRADVTFRLTPDLGFWRTSLRKSAAYGVMAILALLATRVELLLLGLFASGAALGAFGIALKLMDAALLAPVTLGAVMAPTFARLHATSRVELTGLYLRALRFGLVAAVPAALLAAWIGPAVVAILLGDRYGDLTGLLRVMFAAFPFAAAHCLNVALLLGSERQRGTLALIAALLVLQVAIGFALISGRGVEGAAYAFLATSVVSAVVSTICVRNWFLAGSGLWRALAPSLAPGLAMLAAAIALGHADAAAALAPVALFAALSVPLLLLLPLPEAQRAPA